jgi:hypothetical protein
MLGVDRSGADPRPRKVHVWRGSRQGQGVPASVSNTADHLLYPSVARRLAGPFVRSRLLRIARARMVVWPIGDNVRPVSFLLSLRAC